MVGLNPVWGLAEVRALSSWAPIPNPVGLCTEGAVLRSLREARLKQDSLLPSHPLPPQPQPHCPFPCAHSPSSCSPSPLDFRA